MLVGALRVFPRTVLPRHRPKSSMRQTGADSPAPSQTVHWIVCVPLWRERAVRIPSLRERQKALSPDGERAFCGASSDTAFFENHRSTICFLGHRIATCLYRTPMGGCIEKTVAFYIPHNLKIIKYAQRSLLPSPGANERCFFCLQRKEASVKWQFFV